MMNIETIIAKPCWTCLKPWPQQKRKCSCGQKLSPFPTYVCGGNHPFSVGSYCCSSRVFIPASDTNLRQDGSYTFNLTFGETYYGS